MTGSRNYRPPSGTHNYIFDPGQINIALENSNRVLIPVFTGPIHLSISGLSHPSPMLFSRVFSSRAKERGLKILPTQLFFFFERERERGKKESKNYFKNCVYLIIDYSLSLEIKVLQDIQNEDEIVKRR